MLSEYVCLCMRACVSIDGYVVMCMSPSVCMWHDYRSDCMECMCLHVSIFKCLHVYVLRMCSSYLHVHPCEFLPTCIRGCPYVSMCVRACANIPTRSCVGIQCLYSSHMQICVSICRHVYVRAYVVCIVNMCAYVYMCVCVCACVCIRLYVPRMDVFYALLYRRMFQRSC